MSLYNEMRMFVFFDLPTETIEDKRYYRTFRKSILNEGFIMVQFSVYVRYCRNKSEYLKYLRRIKQIIDDTKGEVRIIAFTEKQYEKMHVLSGKKKSDEELLSISPLVFF